MKISLGSDHAGFRYKEKVKELLGLLGHEVKDFGTFSEEPVDYPLFIRPAAEAVARGDCDRGIVFGGSGNGRSDGGKQSARCALRALLERRVGQPLATPQRRKCALDG
jgi:RpiB/LacA/LacB family sugar-phosphate isomerase